MLYRDHVQLTSKQSEVLQVISNFVCENGFAPTLKEIAVATGLSGPSSVQRHVQSLVDLGYLVKDSIKDRSIKIASELHNIVKIPLVGNIACGSPLLAVENIDAYVSYNSSLLRHDPADYFFLKVYGDSMNLAKIEGKNINDGDFVLINKQNNARPKDIIVALIGDDATLKTLDYEDGFPVLRPQSTNSEHKKLIVLDNLLVQGVVVDVIKKGQNYV